MNTRINYLIEELYKELKTKYIMVNECEPNCSYELYEEANYYVETIFRKCFEEEIELC